ncbi:unnamed protein product [marine sediment metagenome]|uniref:Uncharacterized protein n=1 Tax=marine sediment metagenome TaxID=412755 RepID=X0ZU60_9ZZZZ
MAEKLFKQQFGYSSKTILPKRELDKKSKSRKKLKKGVSYISMRINNEGEQDIGIDGEREIVEMNGYSFYFVRCETKKDEKILNDLKEKLENIELSDLINIEEIDCDITKFEKYDVKIVKNFIEINDDIFRECKVKKEKLTGNFLKEINTRENRPHDNNENTLQNWVQEQLTNGSFISNL